MMSNALPSACTTPLARAALAQAPSTTMPVEPETADEVLLGLAAVGLCVLVVWIVRRIARRDKLSLRDTPGRHNRLSILHVLGILLVWFVAQVIVLETLAGVWGPDSPKLLTLVGVAGGVVFIMVSLAAAARTFRLGVVRGMGLSLRHWLYDTARGVAGYLAALPVCLGLLLLSELFLPAREHAMIAALRDLPAGWQAVILIVTIVLAPLGEELFFRGIVQSYVRSRLGHPWAAVLITSVFFSLVHAPYWNTIPALFALSVFIGYNYERSGRLVAPIVTHALFNGVMMLTVLLSPQAG